MTEAEMYKQSAIDSAQLVIEIFNRPQDTGRKNTVLILLNHALESLSKAVLLDAGEEIRVGEGTITFGSCINKLQNGTRETPELAILNDDEVRSLGIIKSNRNEATHGNIDINEQRFYALTRSGITIFNDILNSQFDEDLQDHLPGRVLPISTMPLKHLDVIFQEEKEEINNLLEQGEEARARAKARSITMTEQSLGGSESSPTNEEVNEKLEQIANDEEFREIFPGVSGLSFDVEQAGPSIKVKFTKSEGTAVHVTEEKDAEYVVGYREVDPWDRYSLGIQSLGDKFEMSWQKTFAVVRELGIYNDEEYHQKLENPSGYEVDRYHPDTIQRVNEAVESGEIDIEDAWEKHKDYFGH